MYKTTPGQYQYLVWIILLLLVPALFINLGLSLLITDEATRGVVSFEMIQRGKLMVPTINGEHYYNKPPLYNWILVGFFTLFKQYSEFVLRLPAVISLLLFGLVIYLTTRKELGARVAFLSSLLFISCGRILFYDSMRGLIDMSFSMVVFLNFYLIYYFLSRKKFYSLFLVSYLLLTISFLMKGLPAVIFQGLTLLTAFAYFRSIKKLFHPSHLLGLFVFVILVGGYYYLLWKNSSDPEFFRRLVSESTKRTFIEHGIWTTVKHIFYYPFDQAIHLLPWSLFFLFLFRKSFYNKLRENKYLGYLALVFIVNIPVYWTSVGTHPRYVFMLYPIIIILLLNYYSELSREDIFYKIIWKTFFIISGMALAGVTWYFLKHSISESGSAIVIYCCTLVIALATYFSMWKLKDIRLELLIIILLVVRIFFNLVVVPDRLTKGYEFKELKAVEEIYEITQGSELMLHPVTPVSIEFVYYISTARNEILRKEYDEFIEGTYYLFDDADPLREGEQKVMEYVSSWEERKMRLSIFKEDHGPITQECNK